MTDLPMNHLMGRCTCGQVRYRLTDAPMITHCCHCSWCQRETGSAFAVNALIESSRLVVMGAVEYVMTPSASGKGQEIARCGTCKVALFSHYAGSGRLSSFVRVGTLDNPASCPPDVHIFTESKQDWVVLNPATPQFDAYYSAKEVWSDAAQARFLAMKAQAKA